jgi:hypothetical protein
VAINDSGGPEQQATELYDNFGPVSTPESEFNFLPTNVKIHWIGAEEDV